MAEQTYTREEVEGALLGRDAIDAAMAAIRDPGNKSKPAYGLAGEVIKAAIETGFGPK